MDFLNESVRIERNDKGKETGRKIFAYQEIKRAGGMSVWLSALPENKGKFLDMSGTQEIDPKSLPQEIWAQLRLIKKDGPGGLDDFGITLPELQDEINVDVPADIGTHPKTAVEKENSKQANKQTSKKV